jgi:hypothetical protein
MRGCFFCLLGYANRSAMATGGNPLSEQPAQVLAEPVRQMHELEHADDGFPSASHVSPSNEKSPRDQEVCGHWVSRRNGTTTR